MPKTLKTPPTPEEKTVGLERVMYSMEMVVNAQAFLIENETKDTIDIFISNCVYESFLTHIRNVLCFFNENAKIFDGDIKVNHFTGQFVLIDTQINYNINKLLSHLTSNEIIIKPGWNIRAFLRELYPICLDFLEHAFFDEFNLESFLIEWRVNLIQRLKNEIQTLSSG